MNSSTFQSCSFQSRFCRSSLDSNFPSNVKNCLLSLQTPCQKLGLPRTAVARCKASKRSQHGEVSPASTGLSSAPAALAAAAALLLSPFSPLPALAGGGDNYQVGEFNASGIVFKDSVEIVGFSDPKVDGVTLYISDFKRSVAAKLQKDFFSEPSQASLTCSVSGDVIPTVDLSTLSKEGEEVYKERKNLSLSNKTLRVRRMFDEKANVVVYVAYSTRLSGTPADDVSPGRYKTSMCAVPITVFPVVEAPALE